MKSCATTVGAITSTTVTVAVFVTLFPESVAVKVTVFAPKSAHVKLVLSKLNVGLLLHPLPDPLSTCDGVIVAFPLASN